MSASFEQPGGIALLSLCMVLSACVSPRASGGQYRQSADSATNSCRHNPALCKTAVGERAATVPTARPLPPLAGPQATALTLAVAAKAVKAVIDAQLERSIREALAECATQARRDVMDKHFQRGPTREECQEVVEYDRQSRPVTRAMVLGREQHEAALECVRKKLEQLKPGGFTLSARYRYDVSTGLAQFIPHDVVEALLLQGRSAELIGTLEPDLVIHLPGQPLFVQGVFDFKFPCVNTDRQMPWRKYPKEHPAQVESQGELYERVLKVRPARVQPHLGVSQ